MEITKKLSLFFRSMVLKAAKMNTADGKVLVWDSEDALSEGTEVFFETEVDGKADFVPAEDGIYEMEDGSKVTVAEGKVTAIEKPEAEEAEPEAEAEEPAAEEEETVVEEIEVSDSEIAALTAPAAESADEPEVAEDVTEASPEERMDEIEAHVADVNKALEMLLNAINGFEARLAEVEGKVSKVENEPAAEEAEKFARIKEQKDASMVGKLKNFYSNR